MSEAEKPRVHKLAKLVRSLDEPTGLVTATPEAEAHVEEARAGFLARASQAPREVPEDAHEMGQYPLALMAEGILDGSVPMESGPTCHVCGNPKQAMEMSGTRGVMATVSVAVFQCVTCTPIPITHPAAGTDVANGWIEGAEIRRTFAAPPKWAKLTVGNRIKNFLTGG